jgi:hypothetical protein
MTYQHMNLGEKNNIIKLNYADGEWLRKIALNHLGLNNMNQLRDRFEGQLYLNNFLIRSYLEIAFERYFDVSILSKVKKEMIKNYEPNICINNSSISLIPYTVEDYARIPAKNFDIAILGLVNLEARTVNLTGFQSKYEILKQIDSHDKPVISKQYIGLLKTFDHLLDINTLSL